MLSTSKTHAVINNNETPLSQFVLDSNFTYNTSLTSNLIKNNTLEINQINATELLNTYLEIQYFQIYF